MAETSILENLAEAYVSFYLQRNDILVAKPMFDIDGADLLAMLKVRDGAKFCRVQAKGRSLSEVTPQNSIAVKKRYFGESLVVLMYLDDRNLEKPHLYCFFPSDLKKNPWVDDKDEFVLRFAQSNFETRLGNFAVDSKGVVAGRIKELIRNANMEEVMTAIAKAQNDRKMESVIDAINVANRTGVPIPQVLGEIQKGIRNNAK